ATPHRAGPHPPLRAPGRTAGRGRGMAAWLREVLDRAPGQPRGAAARRRPRRIRQPARCPAHPWRTCAMTAHGTLRFRRRLPGPLDRVWSYLVDPDKRRLWLAGGPMGTRPGGAVELHFRNSELSRGDDPPPEKYREVGNAGTVRGEILRCEPPRLLAFTWGGGPDAGEPPSDATIELEPDGDEVLLTLTHRRLAPGPQTLS